MSNNLSKKDKIVLDPTALPDAKKKGELHLDPTDAESIVEHFSRLTPGDEVSGTFKATLDENGEKAITLSINEITILPDKDAPPEPEEPEESEPDNDSVAAQVIKNDSGVPEQDGNTPAEPMGR